MIISCGCDDFTRHIVGVRAFAKEYYRLVRFCASEEAWELSRALSHTDDKYPGSQRVECPTMAEFNLAFVRVAAASLLPFPIQIYTFSARTC
jgi:hypothetical protein